MAYASFYKETLYYLGQNKATAVGDTLQTVIEQLLGDNLAVGIIGGTYEQDGTYTVQYISSFALNILNMSVEELEERKIHCLDDLLWEGDRHILPSGRMHSFEQIIRLVSKDKRPVCVHIHFKSFSNADNGREWVMSVRSLEIIFNTMENDEAFLLTAFLDLETEALYVQNKKSAIFFGKTGLQSVNYSEVTEEMIDNFVYPDFRQEAAQKLDIRSIRESLEKKGKAEYTVPQRTLNGDAIVVKRKYHYVYSSTRFVYVSFENVTEFYSHDYIAKALNLNGFLIKGSNWMRTSSEDVSLVYFNICNYKVYNTSMGYEKGNELLAQVAEKIRESSLRPLFLCRDGGDHFLCLVLTRNLDIAKVEELCAFSAMKTHANVMVHMSCGVYHIDRSTDTSDDLRNLCKKAKLAEEQVKRDLLHPVSIYQQKFSDDVLMTEALLENFDDALENHHLNIFYQPIYHAATGEIASAEALVRWNHPKYGLLPPAQFVPLLETYNIVSRLDVYVAQEVLRHMETRMAEGKRIIPVSVNISRADLIDGQVCNQVLMRAVNSSVPTKYCRMEITESAYLSLSKDGIGTVQSMHEKGVSVMIDDFGSGFSSFAGIASYVYDYVKLDMEFARMINKTRKANIVIINLIKLCHDLGAKVVAEGVETREQYDFLVKNNCDYIQGYYFSKPVSEECFDRLLDERN